MVDTNILRGIATGMEDQGFGAAAQDVYTAANEIEALRDEIKKHKHGLGVIAKQHLSTEVSADELECADFQGGFDCCVKVARAAMTQESGYD